MNNKEIATRINLLAKLMELHDADPFRVKTYANAYQSIRRVGKPLSTMSLDEMLEIRGIGKSLAGSIKELIDEGQIKVLEELMSNTPPGVMDMLKLKGLGAKKLKVIWKNLEISDLKELEYACFENRLMSLKGFGAKTQVNILDQIAFFNRNAGSVLLSFALNSIDKTIDLLKVEFPDHRFEMSGALKRKIDVIDTIELVGTENSDKVNGVLKDHKLLDEKENKYYLDGVLFLYHECSTESFDEVLFNTTGPDDFISSYIELEKGQNSNAEVMNSMLQIPPECRDNWALYGERKLSQDSFANQKDIQGLIHTHSTWSDGASSIKDMAEAGQKKGYSYLTVTDHSKSAFYANGLQDERVLAQWEEIDRLNSKNNDFRVFKGIESDIRFDGNLDYDDALLMQFELVIASVHANLKMDKDTANKRLISAIEHPATHILGHMTGRLLLGREGYPLDHKKVIDACSANNVAIEINSNPHRLDIDWRWIPYALEKDVKFSISPDAHSIEGIDHVQFGLWMAMKGLIPKECIINTKSVNEFESWLKQKR